jgi:hypothetical protein
MKAQAIVAQRLGDKIDEPDLVAGRNPASTISNLLFGETRLFQQRIELYAACNGPRMGKANQPADRARRLACSGRTASRYGQASPHSGTC